MPPDSGGREAILTTSAKLFSQQGYKEVSIRDIAQACGMTNAALYYHFKNKEDLFLAMLRRDHERTLASLQAAADGPGDLRSDLVQLVARYSAIMCEHRQSFQTLWRDMKQIEAGRGQRLFTEMRQQLLLPLVQRLAAAQAAGEIAPGDVQLYAALLHGMIIALTHNGQTGKRSRIAPAEIETVVDLFLHGLSRQGERQIL
ncbi:MAG: TetR/AcrR family transcriptional regulator [Chloroflexi bacterium]|nr:TetR/AcrR family transcriptional regulator [Chloroflexota bacterium]